MIAVNDVTISLGEHKDLISKSFEISDGLWALVGRNGSGKSTFLNTILQSKKIVNGSISIDSIPIADWNTSELSKKISAVYTKPAVFGNFSVQEVVELGRLPYANAFGQLSKDDRIICDQAMGTLKIENLKNKQFSILSDGEKQLVMIARAIAQDTSIIILDEPTAFLDVVNRTKIIKLLSHISISKKKTILFSTHDVALIPNLCNGLLWISDGRLEASNNSRNFKEIIDKIF